MIPERLSVKIEDINQKVNDNVYKLIERGESAYLDQVKLVAKHIKDQNKKIILLTGPSGAGKTTTSYKLQEQLKLLGVGSYVLNMDDFFKDLDTVPLREDGEPDIEGIVALDVDTVKKCLNDILTTGKTLLPGFDFKTHKRKKEWRECSTSTSDVVIMEGIHALNPQICAGLDENKIYKIYIHCNTDFTLNGEVLLEARELRLLRRLVRDELTRHVPVEKTLELWKHVCDGEEKNIRPYKKDANFFLNSAHFFEPQLYNALLLEDFKKMKDIPTIAVFLEKFKVLSFVDKSNVPMDSLVREFIGE